MRYTNLANLPAPLVSALTYSDYDKSGDISVTALILPPRIRQLQIRHDAEMTEDVSERIWRMSGSIVHKILELADPTGNHLVEERLRVWLHRWDITGKVDLIRHQDGKYGIDDYKFRSVWAAMNAKPEDEAQVNIYALLARHNGFNIEQLRIISLLRDWSKMRAVRERSKTPMFVSPDGQIDRNPPDYPPVGVVVREVPLWSPEEQEAFLGERVRAHQFAEKTEDDYLPLCTEQERWRKPDIWAVKKPGGKRAVPGGLHTSIESARAFAATIPAHGPIEHRPGEDTRCLHYCAVKQFCSYGRTLTSEGPEVSASDPS